MSLVKNNILNNISNNKTNNLIFFLSLFPYINISNENLKHLNYDTFNIKTPVSMQHKKK